MFKSFSGTVSALYARASDTGPDVFPAEALKLVRGLIACDGVMLNFGGTKGVAGRGNMFAALHGEHSRVAGAASEAAVRVCDPLVPAFRFAPDGPLAWDASGCTQAGIRKLLAHGDAATAREDGHWIALYRMHDRAFDEHDAELLFALWPHVRQAIVFNRDRAAYRTAAHGRSASKAAAGVRSARRRRLAQFLRARLSGLVKNDIAWQFQAGAPGQ